MRIISALTHSPTATMGLDIVEMVMEVEETFGIEVPNHDAERLRTVGDLYWYVREHVPNPPTSDAARHDTGVPADEIWERLLDVIQKEAGVKRERLVPTARFADDLGMD
jgi:acyl carrier protein